MNTRVFNYKITRFLLWGLVFSFFPLACKQAEEQKQVQIQWQEERAIAISIPVSLFAEDNVDSITVNMRVTRMNNDVAILHESIRQEDDQIIFKPLIPFTHGIEYKVLLRDDVIASFKVPAANSDSLPEVMAVYPTADTLPENALKMYIVFSRPMQEGQALRNIRFVRNDRDTISVFLDLDQELWNTDRTTLTLWFDPGRVKRELQPNKSLGAPLENGYRYTMLIDESWRDQRGLKLKASYEKDFVAGTRDDQLPDPENWRIQTVKPNTKDALSVKLDEPLDYLLLKNAIHITDHKGVAMPVSIEPAAKETMIHITPAQPWQAGDYTMEIESRLEDMAGNNLNRPFDRDMLQPKSRPEKSVNVRRFRVE